MPERLASRLLEEEPDLRELVAEFVDSLSLQAAGLREAYARSDWVQLRMLAHRIKGAGGSYGYPSISALAAQMEAAFAQHSGGQFEEWIETLEQLRTAAAAALLSD